MCSALCSFKVKLKANIAAGNPVNSASLFHKPLSCKQPSVSCFRLASDYVSLQFSSNIMVDAATRMKGIEPSQLLLLCKKFLGSAWDAANETNFEFKVLTQGCFIFAQPRILARVSRDLRDYVSDEC